MGFGWLARGLGFERRHRPFIHEGNGGVMLFGNRISLPPIYGRDWRKRALKPRIPSKIHRRTIEEPSKNHRNITLTSRLPHASSRLSGGWQFRGWRGEARQEGGSGRQGPRLVDQQGTAQHRRHSLSG